MMLPGERASLRRTGELLAGIVADRHAALQTEGLELHGLLVGAFMQAAELVQGLADAEQVKRGGDGPSPMQDAAMALLLHLGEEVGRNWASGFVGALHRADGAIEAAVAGLRAQALPPALLYWDNRLAPASSIYPEAYHEAAAALLAEFADSARPRVNVIGIRGCGVGPAAMVAATLGAAPPLTVRPVETLDRTLHLDLLPGAIAALVGTDPQALFAIVDGGPMPLCGCVAEALIAAGVSADRLRLFPGHAIIGTAPDPRLGDVRTPAQLSQRQSALAGTLRTCFVEPERLIVHAPDPRQRLDAWVQELVGPLAGPLEELSYGRWREHHYASAAAWPPADPRQERLKFLAESRDAASGTAHPPQTKALWLVKFIGLGREGARRAELAQTLSDAGLTPPLAGYRHGFLVERWMAGAQPADAFGAGRAAFLEHVARYLGFRARHLELDGDVPATSLDELLSAARQIVEHALGQAAGQVLDRLGAHLDELVDQVLPIAIDGKMQPWEWLALPDGRILKADAIDHHGGSDLVSAQDIAWDAAAAICEYDLNAAEAEQLARAVSHAAGRDVSRRLIDFMRPCYLALQLGDVMSSAKALKTHRADDEVIRLQALSLRYARRLEKVLASAPQLVA